MNLPNIQNTVLKMSAGMPKQFPRNPMPQVAFSGRSNVGKSSLLNCLLNRKSLARVSSAPGKTITVNFYDVDGKLFLVDLPGYGYAKRSPEEKEKWSSLTDGYFTANPNIDLLKLVVQLIDVRVGPTKDDLMMLDWLSESNIPFCVVATKCDKLSRPQLEKALTELADKARINKEEVIPFSSETKLGRDDLWNTILSLI